MLSSANILQLFIKMLCKGAASSGLVHFLMADFHQMVRTSVTVGQRCKGWLLFTANCCYASAVVRWSVTSLTRNFLCPSKVFWVTISSVSCRGYFPNRRQMNGLLPVVRP